MSPDVQTQYENDVNELVAQMSLGHKLIMYNLLYNDGLRIPVKRDMQKIKDYIPLIKPTVPDPYIGDIFYI